MLIRWYPVLVFWPLVFWPLVFWPLAGLAADSETPAVVGPPAAAWQDSPEYWGDELPTGSGRLLDRSIAVPDFRRIECRLPLAVEVRVGGVPAVTVSLDDNLQEMVAATVQDSVLVLSLTAPCRPSAPGRIVVTVPQLEAYASFGPAASRLRELGGESFTLRLYGSGAVELDGDVATFTITSYSSGEVVANELRAGNAAVQILGCGNVTLYASRSLTGSSFGSGRVTCFGEPGSRALKRHGRGDVVYR
jgi:hypothetical protein